MDLVTQRLEQLDQEMADITAKQNDLVKACKSEKDPHRMSDLLNKYKLLHNQYMALFAQSRALWAELTSPGPRKLSLEAFLTVMLPILEYTHDMSSTITRSRFAAVPSAVTEWTGFEDVDDVAAFSASLDAKLLYEEPRLVGTFLIQSEMSVRFYMEQHLWQPLEECPTPPPFSKHQFWHYPSVGGPKGDLNWVVVGYTDGSDPQLLLAVAAWSAYRMPVDEGWTLAALYANDIARPFVQDALHHAYGYMQANQLRYTALVTGEVYSFLEREGSAVRVADVCGPPVPAQRLTPQMAMYYVLHKAAGAPGQLIRERPASDEPAPWALPSTVMSTDSLAAAARSFLQALKVLVGFALMAACGKAVCQLGRKQLRPDYSTKNVWTWEELNIAHFIARGATGSAFSGCIGGSPAAIKVSDYGSRFSVLQELQQEVHILDHLHEEQGGVVPRKIAQGFIAESTCYFMATELLGETLLEAPPAEDAALEKAALEELERVHARGVLHRDVRPQNFLLGGRGRVVLTDFAFSKLSDSESDRQGERARIRGFLSFERELQARHRIRKQAVPSPMTGLLKRLHAWPHDTP